MSGNGKHKRALYILENSKPIKLLMFQKMELSSPSSKKQKNPPPKKKQKFLCFRKWNFVTPQKLF